MIFSCFPQVRDTNNRHFESPQTALEAAETALKHLAQNGFQRIFDEWQRCFVKCAALNGEYLESADVTVLKIQILFKIVLSVYGTTLGYFA